MNATEAYHLLDAAPTPRVRVWTAGRWRGAYLAAVDVSANTARVELDALPDHPDGVRTVDLNDIEPLQD